MPNPLVPLRSVGWVIPKKCLKLLQGFPIACCHLHLIVVGIFGPEELLGLVRQFKQLFPVPERNDGVTVAVHDQYRAMDMANVLVVGKFVKGQQRDTRQDSKC